MVPSPEYRKVVPLIASSSATSSTRSGPSIAVLRFANLSGDSEQRYLSDGIAEDIIVELSCFRDIFVIGRSSSFACEPIAGDVKRVARELGVHYVLEGGVRRSANRLRITVQLIDGTTGDQIWADRHDGQLGDVLELQEEIARRIVSSIAPEIQSAEQRRAERSPLANLPAYDLALKAGALVDRAVVENDEAMISDGIALANQAIALDPGCLRAHYAVAWGYCRRGAMGFFSPKAQDDFAAAQAAALRLRQLDNRNHAAYSILGHLAMRRLQHDEALANLREAHRLNPNDATTLRWLSWEESNLGMADDAQRDAEQSLRLSPRDHRIDLGYWALGLAAYVAGDLASSIEATRRAVALNSEFAGHYILLAATLAEMNEGQEARAAVVKLRQLAPGLIESRLVGSTYFAIPELERRYLRALRAAAGVSEPADQRREPAASPSDIRPSPLAILTERERQVIRLVEQGLSNSAIAVKLGLSEHTVKRHIANILTKLDLPTRAAAAALAARSGLP
jgi:TolB-like protein/DNA-binding NarL/FixJ family response regulator